MKYKCIKPYYQYDVKIMDTGDIITMEGTKVYNITKRVDYHQIYNMDNLKSCLEAITDDCVQAVLTDSNRFKLITEYMLDTFKKKNHDYGNSFELSLSEEGLAAARIRLGDKWNRFKNLSKGELAKVKDESLRDTLLDMANYCILTTIWLDKNGNLQNM